jgi:hypothetical protein
VFQLKEFFYQSFQGCIYKMEVLKQKEPFEIWEELKWEAAVSYDLAFLNWQGCPINLDNGVHFMGKGYMVIPNCVDGSCKFTGLDDYSISFTMRTTLRTGVLFMIYGGNGIYIAGFMENNTLTFQFSNINTKVTVKHIPTIHMCDGKWHAVTFSKVGEPMWTGFDCLVGLGRWEFKGNQTVGHGCTCIFVFFFVFFFSSPSVNTNCACAEKELAITHCWYISE